jgi:hypothetical protein
MRRKKLSVYFSAGHSPEKYKSHRPPKMGRHHLRQALFRTSSLRAFHAVNAVFIGNKLYPSFFLAVLSMFQTLIPPGIWRLWQFPGMKLF